MVTNSAQHGIIQPHWPTKIGGNVEDLVLARHITCHQGSCTDSIFNHNTLCMHNYYDIIATCKWGGAGRGAHFTYHVPAYFVPDYHIFACRKIW